jgi:hypothetical protein
VGAQPETLQKNQMAKLYKELYSVTDKADGDRYLMLINNSGDVYFIDNNLQGVIKTDLKADGYRNTLIDGELVKHNDKIAYYAFDLIICNGEDLRGRQDYLLKSRLDRLNDIMSRISKSQYYETMMKKFIYRNVFLGSDIILKEANAKSYKNDGLIFTPMNEPYPLTKKWSGLLKWKPAELNTIDFYSVHKGDNVWELYVQGPTEANKNTTVNNLMLFDVEKLCGTASPDYKTFETMFDSERKDEITGLPFRTNTVIEYQWDSSRSKFVPLRTRWDKTANPKKHGNFSSIACNIWNNIHNPISQDMFLKFTTFSNKDDFFFERMRRFHNKVKEGLYNKYCKNTEYLLELCSGRGGDMHKWIHNNVKNVVGYDISQTNIDECVRRLKTTNNNLNYKFTQMDLTQTDIVKKVDVELKGQKYDNIVCHFAIHYFFENKSVFDNIISVIKNHLNPDGKFIVTYMDKNEVIKMFNPNSQICYKIEPSSNEIVYYLERSKQNGDKLSLFNNKLRIILNGKNILGEGSDEFIVDTNEFVKYMASHNIEVEEMKSFRDIKNEFGLSEYEKDISYMNSYIVFKHNGSCSVDEEVLPLRQQKQEIVPKEKLFDFSTINLLQHDLGACKVSTNYDIIDVLNCLEYMCHKSKVSNRTIETFDDIAILFDNIIGYQPVYVNDPFDESQFSSSNDAIHFTFSKYSIDKKTFDGVETINFDNWYILTHKKKIVFAQDNLNFNIQTTQMNDLDKTTLEQTPRDCDNAKQIDLLHDLSNPKKFTIKQLKEKLTQYKLKVSGNKDDLIARLIDHLKENEKLI